MDVVAGFQAFFGDDWDDALDSLRSAPGALGGVALSALRQVRALDIAVFGLVVAGWLWLVFGYALEGDHRLGLVLLALAPTVLWLAAGVAGVLVFEVSGLGVGVLAYWESYALMLMFALFGVVSLRLALNPRGVRVYRGPVRTPTT